MSRTVVVVDLPPLTALGIKIALASSAQPLVVEAVEHHEKVLALARNDEIDLAVVDPHRPTLSGGLKFCKELRKVRRPPYLLAFSGLHDRRDLMYCMLAGIDSFLSCHQGPERLVSAVESTLRGNREWILGPDDDLQPTDLNGLSELTPRELEVLWMVRERYTNRQIGSALSISPNTAKNHVAAILRKLGMRQRFELSSGAALRR